MARPRQSSTARPFLTQIAVCCCRPIATEAARCATSAARPSGRQGRRRLPREQPLPEPALEGFEQVGVVDTCADHDGHVRDELRQGLAR
jgi:hypothetical protein